MAKSELTKSSVRFLGRIVGSGLKQPDPAKVEEIQAIQRPSTQKQLKAFLGVMGFHRDYLDHYAHIAQPLTDLTSSKFAGKLPWSEVHERAFLALKAKLANLVQLSVPRISGLFILRTDASGVAISGCLYQREDDDINNVLVSGEGERPIGFYSKRLNRSQMAWGVVEREAFAVIDSLRRFHVIIFGSMIVIYSDHNPLTFVVEGRSHSAKLTRWSLALQEHVSFRYAKAKHNKIADYFSRCLAEVRENEFS